MKITPTLLTINQLFGSTNELYVIPTYQRRYSWNERQVWELIEDISQIEDGDTHLLGSIVCLAGHHKAGLNRLELVDGQQRLTTVTIILECIRQRLEQDEKPNEASEIGQLLNAKPLNGKEVKKVALDSIDSEEFNDLLQQNDEREYKNRQLIGAFEIIRGEIKEASEDTLRAFLYKLRNQAVVIRLDVSEAKDAFKLFETINNRGLRLSPTDIIKNFLLGNAARFGVEELEIARRGWADLLLHLDGTNSDSFFRYFLMARVQTRIYTSEIVAKFKSLFMNGVLEAANLPERHNYADIENEEDEADGLMTTSSSLSDVVLNERVSFKEFLDRLVLCARVYSEIVLAKTGDKRIDRHLRNLRMIKAAQTYGFLMHLRVSGCSDKQFRDVLALTEGFVLRRHVCRERSNDTESLFARLCGIDAKAPLQKTKEEYRSLCPSDEKFREEFAGTSFPSSLIERARYCLEKIEGAKHGEHEEIQVLGPDDVHVEHIIPHKIKTKRAKDEFGDWISYLGNNSEALHSKYVDRIGNLTLFAGALNIGASNNPFGKKKSAYKQSAILLTKDLAQRSNFKFSDVNKRSEALALNAVSLWPLP